MLELVSLVRLALVLDTEARVFRDFEVSPVVVVGVVWSSTPVVSRSFFLPFCSDFCFAAFTRALVRKLLWSPDAGVEDSRWLVAVGGVVDRLELLPAS